MAARSGGERVVSDPRERIAAAVPSAGEHEPTVLVVGSEAAKGLASHLADRWEVRLVSGDGRVARAAERDGLAARRADVTSGSELEPHADGVEVAVVAAERDRESLLVAQLLRTVGGVEAVAVALNDPGNREFFEGVDVEVLNGQSALWRDVERALFGEPA